MKKLIKKVLAIIALISALFYQANAQYKALKLGDNSTIKSPSAILELEANNKGLLLPRVALLGVFDVTTIKSAPNSLTVFNTATTTNGTNNVTPGYYYWSVDAVTPSNSKWISFKDDREILPLPPFNIAGSTTASKANTDNIYQNANVGIGDFSAISTTSKLDVNGNARIRALTNADLDLGTYNRTLVADANGNLGYTSNPSSASWLFNDAQTVVMPSQGAAGAGAETANLPGLSIPLIIPAKTTMKVIISYSVPAYYAKVPPATATVGYIGCTLFKGSTEMASGSRKYSTFSNASTSAGSAVGLAINGMTSEEIVNNTTAAVTVTYSVKGYIANAGPLVIVFFGMYDSDETQPQYNWGVGNMTVQSFYKKL